MKLSRSMGEDQRDERVELVLELLGLQREQNSLASKLSGGQRKRLSIAVEYISNPSLFFLDEPDSGLDGIMARSLNENLRDIADSGKIVMVITHSPDRIADLYDKVIVLAKSTEDNCGHLAFFGSIPDAFLFFDADSLEGVVKRINRPDEGGDGKSDFYIKKHSDERNDH
jgi:ABC-type multidrug transport system ATPase subunit